jgi:4-hydroxy-4-methyl-2-oxoglutarate aldolase
VRVGGVTIHPGDLLHGDRNGVTTIPVEIAPSVAEACAEYVAAEALVLDYLLAGKVDPPGYAEARQQCQHRIGDLAKRLKGKP